MRNVGTTLSTFLANGRIASCADLWTFTLPTGTVLRWSGGDRAYTWGGNTYALGPGIERSKVRWSLTLDVDTMQVTILPRSSDLVGATPLALALRRGDFDGAGVCLARAFGTAADGSIAGGVIDAYFTGRIGPLEADGQEFRLTVASPMQALDTPFPRNIVQPQCSNQLFDDVCALNASSWRDTAAVIGSTTPTRTYFHSTLPVRVDNYYALGRFKWLTGANAGRTSFVRASASSNGALQFALGWPDPVAVGDTFEVFAGCDKRQATCSGRFCNVARFRGFPFVPSPETTT